MKKKLFSALIAACLALCGCAAGETELYAVSAGKADAILIQADGAACLIDAGYPRSRGKILFAMRQLGIDSLDAVILTHTDSDHADGLEWLAASDIPVGTWYASRYFMGVKEKKHPAVKAAKARGQEVVWLSAGDSVSLGGATLNVLAPSQPADTKDNDNSLVMMLESTDGRMLLAGDMELPEEAILLNSGVNLACDVLKVANHADDDTTSEAFARATSPRLAIISTDSYEKPSTPDMAVLARLQAVGAEIAVTQEATAGLRVRLNEGALSMERVELPDANAAVVIQSAVPGEDMITIVNRGSEAVDLSGWYLISSRGGEWYALPEGTSIAPGATLAIGTESSDAPADLTWPEKKVIHKSKTDVITLYDANGATVSEMSNGL